MSLAEEWTRLLEARGDAPPDASLGERTLIMAQRSQRPSGDSLGGASSARILRSEMSTGPVARYRFRQRIGRGGMGEILQVEQTSIGRDVALKTLRGEHRDESSSNAFLAETRITAGLEHPGVVPVHDAGIDYLTMKLVEGRTLSTLLEERSDLEDGLADLVEILLRVADCLAFAHSRGILHRDLKPDNIMVGGFGEVYLMDWGLALAFGDEPFQQQLPHVSSASNICAGSPAYLPPEVARGERALVGAASDVFGLGAILHELLGGEPPFDGATLDATLRQAAAASVTPLPQAVVERQGALVELCRHALAADPGERCSMIGFQRALRSWLEASGRHEAARRHHSAAERAFEQAAIATDSGMIYHLLTACANECERALALDQERESTRRLRRDAHQRYASEAIRSGDLVLAQTVLDEDEDPALDSLRLQLAQRFEHRRRRVERTQLARRLAARMSIAVAALLVLAGGFHLIEQRQRHTERSAQARELVAGPVAGIADDQIAHQQAVNRSLQALGLHPDPEAMEPQLRAAALAYTRWAIEHGSAALARSQLRLAHRHGLEATAVAALEGDPDQAGTIAWVATATVRQRHAERERRHQRLTQMVTAATGRQLDPDWRARHLDELASWRADPDDAATARLTGRLFSQLRWHSDPLLRLLGQDLWRVLNQDPAAANLIDQMAGPTDFSLHPGDPDARVQVEQIAARVEQDQRSVPLAMEAVLAFHQMHDRREVSSRIRKQVDDFMGGIQNHMRATANWPALQLLLSYRRYAMALDHDFMAEQQRHYWDDPIGDAFSKLKRASDEGRFQEAIELAIGILEAVESRYAFSRGAAASVAVMDWESLLRLCRIWDRVSDQWQQPLPWLAAMHQTRGAASTADTLLDDAMDYILEGHSFDHPSMVRLMIELRRAGRSGEAILVSRLIAQRSETVLSLNNIGWTLFEAGRLSEALTQTTRALELNPGSVYPWGLQVFVNTALERYRAAVAAGHLLETRESDYDQVLGQYGIALGRLGRRQAAIIRLQRGLEHPTSDVDLSPLREGIRLAWLQDAGESLGRLLAAWQQMRPEREWDRGLHVRYLLEEGEIAAALSVAENGLAGGHPCARALEHLALAHPRACEHAAALLPAAQRAELHLREALALLAWPQRPRSSSIPIELERAQHAEDAPWVRATAEWIRAAAVPNGVAPELPHGEASAFPGDWASSLLEHNRSIRRDERGQALIHAGERLWVWRPLPPLSWNLEQERRLATLLRDQAALAESRADAWSQAAAALSPPP